MENDVLDTHRASEVAAATHADGIEIVEIGHRRVLERSCSPSSSHQPSHGTVRELQQEVVTPCSTSLLSPRERGNHLNDSDSTANHSLSGHFPPRSPSQAAALARTGAEEAVVALSSGVVAQIKALLEVHGLSREQYMSIYDEYMSEREQQQAQLTISMAHAQAQAAAMLNSSSMVAQAASNNNHHSISSSNVINSRQVINSDANDEENASSPLLTPHAHEDLDRLNTHSCHLDMVDVTENAAAGIGSSSMETDAKCSENSEAPQEEETATMEGTLLIADGEDEEGRVEMGGVGVGGAGDGSHVGKMQSLVRSALESYETASPVMSEIGQKRKHFTLEEELRLQPSPFAQQLLE